MKSIEVYELLSSINDKSLTDLPGNAAYFLKDKGLISTVSFDDYDSKLDKIRDLGVLESKYLDLKIKIKNDKSLSDKLNYSIARLEKRRDEITRKSSSRLEHLLSWIKNFGSSEIKSWPEELEVTDRYLIKNKSELELASKELAANECEYKKLDSTVLGLLDIRSQVNALIKTGEFYVSLSPTGISRLGQLKEWSSRLGDYSFNDFVVSYEAEQKRKREEDERRRRDEDDDRRRREESDRTIGMMLDLADDGKLNFSSGSW